MVAREGAKDIGEGVEEGSEKVDCRVGGYTEFVKVGVIEGKEPV